MTALLYVLLAAAAVLASVRASSRDYVACDADPTIPVTKLCWDGALNAVRPNMSLVLMSNRACCPANVTASLVVPPADTIFMGSAVNGANATRVQGLLRIERGALLSVTTTNLTVDGDFVLASGALLRVTESNATQTTINVGGCLVFEAPYNATTLTLELDVADGNTSRAYVIFSVPSGCINGTFGAINTSYTLLAGENDQRPPAGVQCIRPVGLAVLVDMVCTGGETASNGNGNGTGGTPSVSNVTGMDELMLWTIIGVVAGGIFLSIIVAVILLKVRATRGTLFPFRDRVYFKSSPSTGNLTPPLGTVAGIPVV